MLLVTLGIMIGCGTGGISGTYVNEDNPEEYLKLNEDSTFYLEEYGISVTGEWEVKGGELKLSLMGIVVTAEIKGNKIIDEEGKVWVKK